MSNNVQQDERLRTRTKGRDLMRQGIILTGLGVAMWAIGTLFFLLFGGWVVLEVSDPYFGSSLFLLEMLTFLLLIGMALIVRLKLFREKGSATRFGYTATTIGLLLSTLIIWYRDTVFSGFTEGQHHGFTIWLTLTGALTLLVPAVVDRFVRDPAPNAEVSLGGTAPLMKEPALEADQQVGIPAGDNKVQPLGESEKNAGPSSEDLDALGALDALNTSKTKLD